MGRVGERQGQKHQCVVASHVPSTGDLACNPGTCPDWELNQQPFGSQSGTQSTEPHQPGLQPPLDVNLPRLFSMDIVCIFLAKNGSYVSLSVSVIFAMSNLYFCDNSNACVPMYEYTIVNVISSSNRKINRVLGRVSFLLLLNFFQIPAFGINFAE